MDKPSMLKPALIGGALFGLLGAIPVLSFVNCLCCSLVMAGGFLAAYLHSNDCKKLGLEFGAGNGAVVGVIAGAFYAIVNSIVQGVFSILMGAPNFEEILDQMDAGGMPPEALDTAERVIEVMSGPAGVLISVGAGLLIGLVFSTIGGLIGGVVFKAAAAPPAASPPPPPAPPVDPGPTV